MLKTNQRMPGPTRSPEAERSSPPPENAWLESLSSTQQILIRAAKEAGATNTQAIEAGIKAAEHSKGGALYDAPEE